MAYVVPTFNLLMDVWTTPATPGGGPASFVNIACQAYIWSKAPFPAPPWMQARFPIDVVNTYAVGDIYELPIASGRYWKALFLYRMHEGFTNEYWVAHIYSCDNAGTLITRGLP